MKYSTMKIYSVEVDSNKCQWIMPYVDDEVILNLLTFDCHPKVDTWINTRWYPFNPKEEVRNFFSLGTNGAFAFDEKVYKSDLFTLLEMAGEIIPINFSEQRLYVSNVLVCVNALNENNTEWDLYDDGSKGKIIKYSFYPDRISESSLFKIPETSKSEILTYSGIKDSVDEFKAIYEYNNFTGLIFNEIYSRT